MFCPNRSDSSPTNSLFGLLAICLVSSSGCGFGPPDNSYQAPPRPKVTIAHPISQTVTQFVEETGETEVVAQADVRARVQGDLQEQRFEPGQKVSAGEIIFVIEKDEYEAARQSAIAAVTAAEAAIKVSQANVANAKAAYDVAVAEFNRQQALLEKQVITQSDFDAVEATKNAASAQQQAALANVSVAEAERDQAKANLVEAELQLGYTDVKAPISGYITKTAVKVGNLVKEGTVLATVVNRDEMYAVFNISDRAMLQFQKNQRENGVAEEPARREWRGHPVFLQRELDEGYPFEGTGDYADETGIDLDTGTLSLRAIFDNQKGLLMPGLFVKVRVPISEQSGAILIEQKVIGRDQTNQYVMVMKDDETVERRPITTGMKFDGWVVVETGLSLDDWVIVEGIQRARPGLPVETEKIELTPPEQIEMATSKTARNADSAGKQKAEDSPSDPSADTEPNLETPADADSQGAARK